jgi:CMP-N-acetylneuraminic acid synthetase
MTTVAFLPCKLESQRIPRKNSADLGGKPLVRWMYDTAASLVGNCFDELVIYADSEELRPLFPADASFELQSEPHEKPADFYRGVCATREADIYAHCYATAPFLRAESIIECVEKVDSQEYDSALTVRKAQWFFWVGEEPNFNPNNTPFTQTMPPMMMETTGLYVHRAHTINMGRRIGWSPFFKQVSAIEALDIDWPDELELARAVANGLPNLHRL